MSGEQIKPGYKRTEVGVIPEDWEVKRLGSLLNVRHGKSQHAIEKRNGKYPILATGGEIGRTDHFIYDKPSVLIGRKGTIDKPQFRENPFWTVDTLFYTEISNNYSPKFVFYLFNKIDWKSYNEASGVPSLNASTIENIEIAAPPLTEQSAIANTLSDVDALLTKLDQLIAKKRDLKQATMQQLLTGQIRLPGFSGAWEVKRLGDVASLYQPTTISASVFTKDGYPVDGANGIVGYYHDFNHEESQVTVTCRGSTCGTVNKTAGKSWITGNAMVVNCDNSYSIEKEFLYQLLMNQNLTVCITGSGQPQIVRGPLANFEIRIPVDRKEQTAIAIILSDMDAELATLEFRRDKTRTLKQGMMQELLTGRVRLL